jgi:hypothetical protein
MTVDKETPLMPRRIRRLPVVLLALIPGAGLAVAGTSAGAAPIARTAASCAGSTDSLKGGYFIPKHAKGVSCATRRGLENGWQSCRLKHGLKGRCGSRVLGFTCHEGKRSSSPLTFFANVSCTKGHAAFSWTYEQNTV